MTKQRVLYLTYDGLTDPLGQSQILPYLCGLAKKYSITIISFEKRLRYAQSKSDINQLCETYGLQWCPLVYHKNPPVLSTLYDLWKLRRLARKLQSNNAFTIVHCRSYLTALVGLWMKEKFNTRFIFDMRGFWADERVEGGLWNLQNPLYSRVYRFFKRKERTFLQQTDYAVVLTEAAGKIVSSWNAKAPVKIIPCCVDMELFNPSKVEAQSLQNLREQLGVHLNDFVIGYIGSLGTWYLYPQMVEFFNLLKKVQPAAKMLFLTPDINHVEKRDDFIVRTATRQQVPEYLSICQASLCFIKPAFSKQGSSATKMAEVMAMGIPLVINSGWGDASEIVQRHQSGVVVSSWSEQELSGAINSLLTNNFSADRNRQIALDYFSLDSGIKKYFEIYDTLSD